MTVRARRAMGDTLMSAAAVAVVILVLVSVDVRVREQVQRLAQAAPASTITDVRARVREVGSVMFAAARHRSIDHAPLLIFVATASVLLLAMMRR